MPKSHARPTLQRRHSLGKILIRAGWVGFLTVCALAVSGCAHHTRLKGFAPTGAFGERTRVIRMDPGVTATVVTPAVLDFDKRIDLILYALPNGNSTAETIGRKMVEGVPWRYDIQNIAAQTRALRTMGIPQTIVVYLEADKKSWPQWRQAQGYDRANNRIVEIVAEIRAVFGKSSNVVVSLTGHSGGGSFIFGFVEGQEELPSWLERIAFLDANYNFDARHGPKLEAWLARNPQNTLVVLAYDDRNIMLDGKKVVSVSGGTWRASQRMIGYFKPSLSSEPDSLGPFRRYFSPQIEILVHPNPENRILHTEMIGEMNGFMHAMLVRRPAYDGLSLLRPVRAYQQWVDGEVILPGR